MGLKNLRTLYMYIYIYIYIYIRLYIYKIYVYIYKKKNGYIHLEYMGIYNLSQSKKGLFYGTKISQLLQTLNFISIFEIK